MPVPRVFEALRDGDVAPGFWEYYGVDPRRPHVNPQEKSARTIRALIEHCRPQGRILSVGCGYGLYEILLSFLDDRVDEIIGVDILDSKGSDAKIQSMTRFVGRTRADRVRALLADAGRLPFRRESFDSVIAIDCLSHADYMRDDRDLRESQRFLLDEMVRVLRIGGLLAVVENNEMSPRNVMRKHCTFCHPVNPFYLRSVLRRLGFNACCIVPYYDLAERRDWKAQVARGVLDRSSSLSLFIAPLFILHGRNG